MNQPVENIIIRTKRYWFVDGLNEMASGLVLLMIGLLYLITSLQPPHILSALVVGIGQPIIILLGWWFSGKAVKHLKERFTYPRTGFVAYPRSNNGKRRWRVALLAGVVGVGVTFLLMLLMPVLHRSWLVVITAAAIAVFTLYIGLQVGVFRFYILALFTLLLGIVITAFEIPEAFEFAALLGGAGLAWMVSGGLTLLFYLRRTHPAAEGTL